MKEFKHVQYLDLYGNGVLKEAVVVKTEVNGDKHFIQTDLLDVIDLERLRHILDKRDSNLYPMWDLMSQTMLRNGMNALEYFDQLVLIKTAAGPIIRRSNANSGLVYINVGSEDDKTARKK